MLFRSILNKPDIEKISGKDVLAQDAMKDNYMTFYMKKELMEKHLHDLEKFVIYCEQTSIPLVVVLFPSTWDIMMNYTERYANQPIREFFEGKGIPVLDTYTLLKNIPEKDRIVNFSDAHPGEKAQLVIAEELYRTLVKNDLLEW